jgi:UDP-GlcNAc:undecaprenyl-phosphate GlcNAc-1-phosphate transferase
VFHFESFALSLLSPLLAFSATTVLIVLLRPMALALGLVDVPNARKSHQGQIPLIGGMSIFVGVTVALTVQYVFVAQPTTGTVHLTALFGAAFILVFIGIWDDYSDLPPTARLLTQLAAALIMIYGGGVVLNDVGALLPGAGVLSLGLLAVPFTVFACIGVINAINMIDGLDGLSGSLTLISLLGLGVANSLWGDVGNQHVIVIVAACVMAFLLFNLRTLWRSRAWVFLGDAGSMFLGLTLCWLAISMSQGENRVISPAAALWFLMLPIYDAVSMMLRRILKGRSPFQADREHLHHIFLFAGFSVGESVTLMSGIAVVGVVIGLGGTYWQVPDWVLAGLFLVGGGLFFWVVRRAWRVMRFLRRSICRRSKTSDRRASTDRRDADEIAAYADSDRRSGVERRLPGGSCRN